MSNLKLPDLSFNALWKAKKARIAYKTTAEYVDRPDKVGIYHHDNLIAVLKEDSVFLWHSGWISRTTTARLHTILRDNIPGNRWGVRIRNFTQELVDFETNNAYPLNRCEFRLNAGGSWELVMLNSQPFNG